MDWLYSTLAGKLLRLPLKMVPCRTVLPILSGPLRGARWEVGAGFDAHWLGIYESAKARLITSALQEGDTFWDVGANVGYYTLLASRRVGPAGRVVAFEPLEENVAFLRRHLDRNEVANVTVIEAALGRVAGKMAFEPGPSRSQGRLCEGGRVLTSVLAGDAEVAGGRLPVPDVLKMDIEGGEVDAIAGMSSTLERTREVFVATHGSEARSLIQSLGRFTEFAPDEFVRRS